MRCNRVLSITVVVLMFGLLLTSGSATATAQTYWQADPDVVGDWFDPLNWSAGLPTAVDEASIDNGGVASILNGQAEAQSLTLGPNGVGGVNQLGGTLSIEDMLQLAAGPGSLGTYVLAGGELLSWSTYIGRYDGDGLFLQTGGIFDSSRIYLGRNSGRGRYLQTGGENRSERLFVGSSSPGYSLGQGIYELIGGNIASELQSIAATGLFSQAGGTNDVEYLKVEGGRYEYLGGSLQITRGLHLEGELDFGGSDTALSVNAGILNFSKGQILGSQNATLSGGEDSLMIFAEGFDPSTAFEHFSTEGLTHTAGTDLIVPADKGFEGSGTISDFVDVYGWIQGGHNGSTAINLTQGIYVHDGANVNLEGRVTVTNDRSGIDGGILNCYGYLLIGRRRTNLATLKRGVFRQTAGAVLPERVYVDFGRYELSGGTIDTWYSTVGSHDNEAEFIQTGGEHRVGNTLTVTGSGMYVLYAGKLSATTLVIGAKHIDQGHDPGGTLALLNPAADIRVAATLSFGAESVLVAVPGSTIRFTGDGYLGLRLPVLGLHIQEADPASLSGLGNLTVIFEAGEDLVYSVEVAGEDRGSSLGGFFENFALGTLQIGGEDSAWVQLVDDFDNQPGWLGSEALYVSNLNIGGGSYLDLNGLNLYYLEGSIDPAATILYNGGNLIELQLLLPGDFDGDGDVDGVDFGIWQANYYTASGASPGDGDFDGDGDVDGVDFGIWQANYPTTAGGSATIPEPATLALLLIGSLALFRRRSK